MRQSVSSLSRYVANTIVLVLVMLSPFVVYKVVKAVSKPSGQLWPADVVLLGSAGDQLTSLSILRIQPPLRIDFPVSTALDIPTGGRLRALTAFKIGGAKTVAGAVASTIGYSYMLYANWNGKIGGSLPITSDLDAHVKEIEDVLANPALVKLAASGHQDTGTYFSSFTIDVKKTVSELQSQTPSDFASPSASPSAHPTSSKINPALISIQVLNEGARSGAATKTVQLLQQKGFALARVATGPGGTANGNVVYYSKDRRFADAVASVIGIPAKVAKLPATFAQSVDVVVILGAQASPTPTNSP